MFFFPRVSSFLPLSAFSAFAAFAVVALVAACSSKTNNTPAQECTTQAYPTLACGSIKACASGKGNTCTSATLELPDGKKFTCASCSECKKAQDEALAACDNKEPPAADTDGGGTVTTTPESDAAAPPVEEDAGM